MANNYEYAKIKSQIGEIRIRKAFALKNAGCFALCGSFIGSCFIQNPSVATSSILGIDVLFATYYGVRTYMYQRKINKLNEESNKIKCKLYTE